MRRLAVTVLIALSFVWFGACRSCMAQQIIGRPMLPISGDPCVTCTQYLTANTATSAGGTLLVRTNIATVGIADSKVVTVSFWMKRDSGATGIIFQFLDNITIRLQVSVTAGSGIQIDAKNSAGVGILQGLSPNSVISSGTWFHVLICVDLSDVTKRHIYINGVDQVSTWVPYTNDTMDLAAATPARALFNDFASQATPFTGSLAEFWIDDVYHDVPCHFYCSGHPANLGSDGSLPTGSAPAIYLSKSGSGVSWRTDSSGNGNNFAGGGTLTSTTSP